ncbi:MAG: hypothetical protein ACRD01_03875 [Terriglobales bacterium]
MKYSAVLSLAVFAALAAAAAAQAPQQMVFTLVPQHGSAPAIQPAQISIEQGRVRAQVATVARLTGRVDLCIALDEDTRNLGTRLDDIKDFVRQLPANVAVVIVYMHTGTVAVASPVTFDRNVAVKALRLPTGAANSSPDPYGSLQHLFKIWRQRPGTQRELVVLTDGQQDSGGNDPNNPAIKAAIAEAVAGGIVVFPIYAQSSPQQLDANTVDNGQLGYGAPSMPETGLPAGAAGAGFKVFKASQIQTNQGLQNLSLLSDATGGETYSGGQQGLERLTPYFRDISTRLQSQYVVSYILANDHERGPIGVKVQVKDAAGKLTAPKQITVARR